jgi:hypothetical protein
LEIYTRVRNKLAKAELGDQLREIINEVELTPEEEAELAKFGENPLVNILSIFTTKHTATEKEIKAALTGLLYTLRILSIRDGSGILKVVGSSSAGKTNLVNTILDCFPPDWVKTLGSITANAIKYIKWDNEKILYIQEAGGAEETTEHLKLMDSGDGGFTAAVTVRGEDGEFITKEYEIPVKFIITTRAEGVFDQQLENRMFSISIDESDEQTFRVLFHRCRDFAGHNKTGNFKIIRKFIKNLQEFDEIKVPYSYEFLNIIKRRKMRVRRDIDKILSLCQTLAFLNQRSRPLLENNGKKILFSTPEDAYNVFTLAFSSFEETLTGVPGKLKILRDALPEDKTAGLTYREIAKKIGWYKMKAIRATEELDNLGYVEIDTSSRTHIVRRGNPLDQNAKDFEKYKLNFLAYTAIELSFHFGEYTIPLTWCDINDVVNRNTERNNLIQNHNPYHKDCNNDHNKIVTNPTVFYTKNELLDYFGKNKKTVISHFCYGNVTMFVTISTPYKNVSFKYCNIVTKSKRDPNVTLDVSFPSCYDVTPKGEKSKTLKDSLSELIIKLHDLRGIIEVEELGDRFDTDIFDLGRELGLLQHLPLPSRICLTEKGINWNVKDGFEKSTEENPAQYDKIQEIKKKIEKDRKAGYNIDIEYLYHNFDHVIIDRWIQNGQLIKRGNGEYVFGS